MGLCKTIVSLRPAADDGSGVEDEAGLAQVVRALVEEDHLRRRDEDSNCISGCRKDEPC